MLLGSAEPLVNLDGFDDLEEEEDEAAAPVVLLGSAEPLVNLDELRNCLVVVFGKFDWFEPPERSTGGTAPVRTVWRLDGHGPF